MHPGAEPSMIAGSAGTAGTRSPDARDQPEEGRSNDRRWLSSLRSLRAQRDRRQVAHDAEAAPATSTTTTFSSLYATEVDQNLIMGERGQPENVLARSPSRKLSPPGHRDRGQGHRQTERVHLRRHDPVGSRRMEGVMQIGRAAAQAGVSIKAIRHWEDEGLLPEVPRKGRYRQYGADHVARLRLVAHCREQGFSLSEIREIIALLPATGCPEPLPVRALVRARLGVVRDEIARLQRMEERLLATASYLDARVG